MSAYDRCMIPLDYGSDWIFEMTQGPAGDQFTEITSVRPACLGDIAITVRVVGIKADFHSGADPTTVEAVLRVLMSC